MELLFDKPFLIGICFIVFGVFWIIFNNKYPLNRKDPLDKAFDYTEIFSGAISILIGAVFIIAYLRDYFF